MTTLTAGVIKASLDQLAPVGSTVERPPQELADKFSSLMQKAPMSPPVGPQEGDSTSIASQLIAAQDVQLQETVTHLGDFSLRAQQMSPGELAQAGMEMSMELANTQFNLTAKMSVVDSSKDAIKTLMTNSQ